MGHVVLLGDSIFDNGSYVPDGPALIEQLRLALAHGWDATLLAIDGSTIEDVARQLKDLPTAATHLVVSAGGNDALGESSSLGEPACTVGEALALLDQIRSRFRNIYRSMLKVLSAAGKPSAVCTIYDSIPGLGPAEQVAVAQFNEVILREAFSAGLPLIDLRIICNQESDYSHVSPIEPSATGGAKIAKAIVNMLTIHEFRDHRSTIYV